VEAAAGRDANPLVLKKRRGKMDRCLFLDDWHIARMEGLARCAHPAKRYEGNPVMVKELPWEKMRLQLYGRCIVYNNERQRFQLFYIAQPTSSHYPNLQVGESAKVGYVTLPAYAESEDGIHWERPLQSDLSFEEHYLTNILDLHEGQRFDGSGSAAATRLQSAAATGHQPRRASLDAGGQAGDFPGARRRGRLG